MALKPSARGPKAVGPPFFARFYPSLSVNAPTPYESVVLAHSPTAYLRLGELSGTRAKDATFNAHDGTYSGTYTLGQAGVLSNDPDPAVLFTNGQVALGSSVYDARSASFSMECWIKTPALNPSANQYIMGAQVANSTDQHAHLVWRSTAVLAFGFFGDDLEGPFLAPTTTYHVVATYDASGDTATLYVNGIKVAASSAGPLSGASAPSWFIGKSTLSDPWTGTVDEVAIYNYALTPAQITAHFQAQTGPAPPVVVLGTSDAAASPTLALSATTQIPLDASVATSSATLALTAKTQIPLDTSAATASATLALTAKTQVPLDASSAVASATLALSASTQVPLGASTATASTSLALTAPTQVPLGTSAATSSTSLALTAPTVVPLGASSATSTASLALTAPTQVPLAASSGQSSSSLALTAAAQVPLAASSAVSSTSLALTAKTQIPLDASTGTTSASLTLSAPAVVSLDASSAASSSTLAVSTPTQVPLGASSGSSSASLTVATPFFVVVALQPASGVSSASLHVGFPSSEPGPNYLDLRDRHSSMALDPGSVLVLTLGDNTTEVATDERSSGAPLDARMLQVGLNDNATQVIVTNRHSDAEVDALTKELTLDAT